MKKVFYQILVNFLIIFLSVLVIFFAKTVVFKETMPYNYYLCSDLVFVMLSSLLTMMGWRYVESIFCKFWEPIVLLCVVCLAILYGMSLICQESYITDFIRICVFGFILFYLIENFLVIRFFAKQKNSKDNGPMEPLGYKKCGENQGELN